MRCRLGAGTHVHGNAVIYARSIVILLRGPSPPGGSSGLLGGSKSTQDGFHIDFGTPLGLVCSVLVAEDGLGSVVRSYLARFWCPLVPFRRCFGILQADFDHQNCPPSFDILCVIAALVVVVVVEFLISK